MPPFSNCFLSSSSSSKKKAVLQTAESMMPAQLGLLNYQLVNIFGEKYSSAFMQIKPIELFWNGIPLCVNTTGMAKIVCSIIKNQKTQTMKEMSDGSLRFSFFGHVR